VGNGGSRIARHVFGFDSFRGARGHGARAPRRLRAV